MVSLSLALTVSAIAQPVAYWSFDGDTTAARLAESLGQTALDASETNGSSSWNTRSGFGNVLANGSGTAYLSVAQHIAITPGSGNFSISLWAYRTSDANSTKGLLDALDSGATTGYQLFYQTDNTIRIRIDDNNGNHVLVDTQSAHYQQNIWQNIIVTVDRSKQIARIYVNGSEATTAGGVAISALTGSINLNQNLWIGTLNGTAAARGRLDDIGLFNYALSTSEIAAINVGSGVPLSEIDTSPVASVIATPTSGSILRIGDTVTLSTNEAADAIYYTLDGSVPDNSAKLYTAPFTVPANATLQAIAYKNNSPGVVTSAFYTCIPNSPPNILIIMADDIGYGDLSCYGAPTVHTPHLDALARKGSRFTQFTTTGPGDLANQYALLTGRLARRGNLPADIPPGSANSIDYREWTLAKALRKKGYQTAMIGEWNLGDSADAGPNNQGFQLFYGLPYSASFIPTPPLVENETTLEAAHHSNLLLDQLSQRASSWISAQGEAPFFLVFSPPSLPATGGSLLGNHGNRMDALDRSIGDLLDTLEQTGKTNDTLVVFLSDEGPDRTYTSPSYGSAGIFRDGKSTTWEGGVRTPAISRWPGIIPAGTSNQAVLWLPDLYTSITAIADAHVPDDRPYDGTARADVLLSSRTRPDAETTLFLHRHDGTGYQLQAIRQGAWKYHATYQNSATDNNFSESAPLLFQIEQNPTEHINRSSTHTSKLVELQSAASTHLATFASPLPQLPITQPGFLSPPALSILTSENNKTSFAATLHRPVTSTNDEYAIQYSHDLSEWFSLAIDPYILTIDPQTNHSEIIELRIPSGDPSFSNNRVFFRIINTRP